MRVRQTVWRGRPCSSARETAASSPPCSRSNQARAASASGQGGQAALVRGDAGAALLAAGEEDLAGHVRRREVVAEQPLDRRRVLLRRRRAAQAPREGAYQVVQGVDADSRLLHQPHVEQEFKGRLGVVDVGPQQRRRRVDVDAGARVEPEGAEGGALAHVERHVGQVQGRGHAALRGPEFVESSGLVAEPFGEVAQGPGGAVAQPGGGDAQGEGQVAAELGQLGRRLGFGLDPVRAEGRGDQGGAVLRRHQADGHPADAVEVQESGTAGDQHQAARGGGQQRGHLFGVGRVVQEQQQPAARHGGPPQVGPGLGVAGDALVADAERPQQVVECRTGRHRRLLARGEPAQVHVELSVGEPVGEVVGGPHGERGLPRTAHAVDGHHPGGPGVGAVGRVDAAQEFGHLLGAAGEIGQRLGQGADPGGRGGRAVLDGGRGRLRQHESGLVAQDVLVEPGQRRAGIDAELVGEELADPGVLVQCLGLPAGAVQGEHELPVEGLAQRVCGDHGPQVGHEFAAEAESQAQFEELLGGHQPAFLQRGGRRLDDRAALAGEDGAVPQRERGLQFGGGLRPPLLAQGLFGGPDPVVELQQVELRGGHDDAVAAALGGDDAVAGDAAPQVRDGLADLVGGGRRRIVPPGRLDEARHGHHPAGLQEQDGQHPLLDGAAQREPRPVDGGLQRPEDPETRTSRSGRRFWFRAFCMHASPRVWA
ncbi:hypothetical protein GCM10020227_07260 [Streptomyces flavovirens]